MTLGSDDGNVCRMLLRRNAIGHEMQQRLFGPELRLLGPVSDADIGRALRDLRAAAELDSFRLWLVGSRVDPGQEGSDVDVVLSPRPGAVQSVDLIEHALWHCREYGLRGTTPACVIDPCFRVRGPAVAVVPLRPHDVIKTVKLLSPRMAALATRGRLREWRRLGEISIEFLRRAEDTDYYGKLPRGDFDGSRWPYLRPAIEITSDDDRDLARGMHRPGLGRAR